MARWLIDKDYLKERTIIKCSGCNEEFVLNTLYPIMIAYRYCPKCQAKIEWGEKDG